MVYEVCFFQYMEKLNVRAMLRQSLNIYLMLNVCTLEYVHTVLKTVHGELRVGRSEIQTRTS
jgi:hypothetical protein